MNDSIAGKVVVIKGASSALGEATARPFSPEGELLAEGGPQVAIGAGGEPLGIGRRRWVEEGLT
jgi:NAD(P)-dependent dehydrogenase (short-subunit alcohol dehydrogenase family)